jgi:hypothetical protein
MKISGESVHEYLVMMTGAMGRTKFYDMLLERGQEFTPAPLPPEIRQRTMKLCFDNSERLAKQKGLLYVEGMAISHHGYGLPFHHAWNATEDGTVIDTTWVPEGISYWGIIVPVEDFKKEKYLTALGLFA